MKAPVDYVGTLVIPFLLSLFRGDCELTPIIRTCPLPDWDQINDQYRGVGCSETGKIWDLFEDGECDPEPVFQVPGSTALYNIDGSEDYFVDVSVGAEGIIVVWTSVKLGIVPSSTTRDLRDVCHIGQGDFIVVGDSGTILKSTDEGSSWAMLPSPTTNNLYVINCGPGEVVRVFGADLTGFQSTDGGTTWTEMDFYGNSSTNFLFGNDGPPDLYASVFVDVSIGYAFGEFGVAFKTTDGGSTWQPGFVPGFNRINTAYFSSIDSGVVAGDNGTIRFTTDGALSWFEDSLASSLTTHNINHIEVNEADSTAVIVGDSGTVIFVATDSTLLDVRDVDPSVPQEYELSQNYPNPFNSLTTFQFTIVDRQSTILSIYDLLGREVATLVNETRAPGAYEVTWDASGQVSGVYYYRLNAGDFVETKKLILLK